MMAQVSPIVSTDHTSFFPHASAQHYVVGIGASAGGLQAISVILSALPSNLPAAIIIVQHTSPHRKCLLARILSRHTRLCVREAEENDRLAANTVFIAPPGKHLILSHDGAITFSIGPKIHFARPSVDVLFQSLASRIGSRVIGVVLTGNNCDGAEGIQEIKSNGGVTIAQDEESSDFPRMPCSAAMTGDVDFILPLSAIAPKIMSVCAEEIQS
ncbi:MAG: chemotaxis protein CheB [Capsulimonas sp.]|uniref:chemotaxis protein CheB n=1 Tax=Capsulimonas sp. TaxID=2494211 RepID=UPI00326648DF